MAGDGFDDDDDPDEVISLVELLLHLLSLLFIQYRSKVTYTFSRDGITFH